ncbi:MAG: hypothetical protein KBC96_04770 [Armatimonadetes bacterium]|nr:hypothetical protein [Armatimonadota bacterium]
MKRAFALVAAIVLIFPAIAAQAAPVQWPVAAGGNDHWYEAVYVPNFITWTEADLASRSVGGHLATVAAEPENQFIYSLISDDKYWRYSNNMNGPWIGGYQDLDAPDYSEPDGAWRWVTSEPMVYTNWATSQPDNGWAGTEHCLHFFGWLNEKSSKWNDARNVEPILGYVVEYDVIPEPSGLISLVGGLCGLAKLIRRQRR